MNNIVTSRVGVKKIHSIFEKKNENSEKSIKLASSSVESDGLIRDIIKNGQRRVPQDWTSDSNDVSHRSTLSYNPTRAALIGSNKLQNEKTKSDLRIFKFSSPKPMNLFNKSLKQKISSPTVNEYLTNEESFSSTEEEIQAIRRRSRSRKKFPKNLTQQDYDLINENLKQRLDKKNKQTSDIDRKKVDDLLKLDDNQFFSLLMNLGENTQRIKNKSSRNRLSDPKKPDAFDKSEDKITSTYGTKFLPAVWSLPHGKIKPPGVYIDDELLQTGPNTEDFLQKSLLNVGPFGVGEAKACLDDLQAHLLSYYSKIYTADSKLPIEYQLDNLSKSYYPSVIPLSHKCDKEAQNLANKKNNLPPKNYFDDFVNPDQQQASLEPAQTKNTNVCDNSNKNDLEPQSRSIFPSIPPDQNVEMIPKGTTIAAAKKDIGSVMNDLLDLADNNSKKVNSLIEKTYDDIFDPTSRADYRLNSNAAIKCPRYKSTRSDDYNLIDLEDTVETMYKNLRIAAEWNERKIKLLQDRIKILKKNDEPRIAD